MTLPTTSEKSRTSETSCTSSNQCLNSFYSAFFSNLTSQQQQQQQQQQQLFLAQLLLSGATCPPINPLANALQILFQNSSFFLQQQQSQQQAFLSSPISFLNDNNTRKETYPNVNSKHKNELIDYSTSDTNDKSPLEDDDNSPTIATTLAAHHNDSTLATDTTIDGINLEEIKQFAKAFKLRRLALGLTQTQVGQALSVTRGPAYSQSAICRFEKLDITPKSASKIKPVLEKWMQEAELKYADRLKSGPTNLQDLVADFNTKKRKRRTSFTPQALEKLNDAFELNTHPSGIDMSTLAQELNYDREVIRVWFCNKRQALKNSTKKFKSNQINDDNESTSSSLLDNKLSDKINNSKVEQDEILS